MYSASIVFDHWTYILWSVVSGNRLSSDILVNVGLGNDLSLVENIWTFHYMYTGIRIITLSLNSYILVTNP